MFFHSAEFIWIFLPLTLMGFLFFERRFASRAAQLSWLILASLIFYGAWNAIFVPLLVFSVLVNFSVGQIIEKQRGTPWAKAAMAAMVSVNILVLGVFKYSGFVVTNLDAMGLQIPVPHLLLPLAISFFTFQQISYVVDVYWGKAPARSFVDYLLFVVFFPHLIAGPILHHSEILPQFAKLRSKLQARQDIRLGLVIFAMGLFKKVILSDSVEPYASLIFARAGQTHLGFVEAWIGALAYTAQIYFDFSGYSDMAVGLARLFGIKLPVNFNSPYKSLNIVDFWRRWHITLSRLLRDYLYIPLGGNRKGGFRRYINLFLTMLIGGLWHGASWNFVIWGGLHGFYLVINHSWNKFFKVKLPAVLGWAMTFIAVVIAWVFFRADSFLAAKEVLSAMVSPELHVPALGWPINAWAEWIQTFLPIPAIGLWWLAMLFGIALFLPNTYELLAGFSPALDAPPSKFSRLANVIEKFMNSIWQPGSSLGQTAWRYRFGVLVIGLVAATSYALLQFSTGSGATSFIYAFF